MTLSPWSCVPGRDVEEMVKILINVESFDELVNWLNLRNKLNSFKGNCNQESMRVECYCRRLVDMYCQWKGLHETVQDLARVLEHDMHHMTQAEALLKLFRKCIYMYPKVCDFVNVQKQLLQEVLQDHITVVQVGYQV